MLDITNIFLDLITDVDLQLFIEKGMRGGISYSSLRYARGNNEYMRSYNNNKELSYIMPKRDFKGTLEGWVTRLERLSDKKGLIVEVNSEYPEELPELHNDYTCAAERLNVTDDMLPPYATNIKDTYKISNVNVKSQLQHSATKKILCFALQSIALVS